MLHPALLFTMFWTFTTHFVHGAVTSSMAEEACMSDLGESSDAPAT